MKRSVPYIVLLLIVLAVISGSVSPVRALSLINGDFETGDLTGWRVFTNQGVSSLGEGFPQVVLFDTNGNGVETFSAVFRVGGSGGGIIQSVNLSAGDLTITLDIAAFAPVSNFAGGFFEVSVDGRVVATHDFGFISGGSTERASLTGTTTVTAGTHDIIIEISRSSFGQSSNTPLQYIDNVVLSGTATVGGNKCPLDQGFWKNHPDAWPVTSLTLGSQTYTQAQLLTILTTPVRADASLILADQLIAAKLNIADGSNPASVSTTITDANNLLSQFGTNRLPYSVTTSSAIGQQMVNDANVLDRYNNGDLTPDCQP